MEDRMFGMEKEQANDSSEKNSEKVTTINPSAWFREIVGCSEKEFRSKKEKVVYQLEEGGPLLFKNLHTGHVTSAGTLTLYPFSQLVRTVFSEEQTGNRKFNGKFGKKKNSVDVEAVSKGLHDGKLKKNQVDSFGVEYVEFVIITRMDNPDLVRFVDIGHLQASPENRNSVFQVASNFNTIEGSSDESDPEEFNFTEKYSFDRTQGPAASVSAGAAAIARVHCPFYHPNTDASMWCQTRTRQLNVVEKLWDHFPQNNGYVILTGDEPKFPKYNSKEYNKLLLSSSICYHRDCQVTTGHRSSEGLEKVNDPEQVVDQVFCAAINIHQGISDYGNSISPSMEAKCRFILDIAYQGTYLSALTNQRKQIFLTFVGGGVFGNKKEWIYDAIVAAHRKWGVRGRSSLERVLLVVFSGGVENAFIEAMRDEGMDVRVDVRI